MKIQKSFDEELINNMLKIIKSEPHITVSSLADKLKMPQRTMERLIKTLKKQEILVHRGGRRYGYWDIVDKKIDI